MQLLKIDENTTLSQLTNTVGSNSVAEVLHLNQLTRRRNIGEQFTQLCSNIGQNSKSVDWQRKLSILNQATSDSDIYEMMCASTDQAWKVVSELNTLPGYLRLPDRQRYPLSESVVGDNTPVRETISKAVQKLLTNPPHQIDMDVFNEYSSIRPTQIVSVQDKAANPFQNFRIPWGEVTLHSSLTDDYVDFPVYPNEVSDSRQANFTQMPDLLYQYEPWQIYTSSGPRATQYTFDFHRDMWSGDHRDGKANELVRFCEAHCYPHYNGAAVHVGIVTLWVAGYMLIRGVITNVNPVWDGPLGLDNWYLHCKLTIDITEVSDQPLSFTTVLNKPLIG